MAIRLRVVDGTTVALCAARSVGRPGDLYLDDTQHMALARKFWQDYPELGIETDAEILALTEREESNNVNRTDWDTVFAANLNDKTGIPRPWFGDKT